MSLIDGKLSYGGPAMKKCFASMLAALLSIGIVQTIASAQGEAVLMADSGSKSAQTVSNKKKKVGTDTKSVVKRPSNKAQTAHSSGVSTSSFVNGPTGAGKPGAGGPGSSAGTNSTGVNGPDGPVSGPGKKP